MARNGRSPSARSIFYRTMGDAYQRYDQKQEIIIHPPIHTQLPINLPIGQTSGNYRAEQRAWEANNNASSVRDYRVGDPLRWVHWPISAKRNALFVREFDLDTS